MTRYSGTVSLNQQLQGQGLSLPSAQSLNVNVAVDSHGLARQIGFSFQLPDSITNSTTLGFSDFGTASVTVSAPAAVDIVTSLPTPPAPPSGP